MLTVDGDGDGNIGTVEFIFISFITHHCIKHDVLYIIVSQNI